MLSDAEPLSCTVACPSFSGKRTLLRTLGQSFPPEKAEERTSRPSCSTSIQASSDRVTSYVPAAATGGSDSTAA